MCSFSAFNTAQYGLPPYYVTSILQSLLLPTSTPCPSMSPERKCFVNINLSLKVVQKESNSTFHKEIVQCVYPMALVIGIMNIFLENVKVFVKYYTLYIFLCN
jgi:hypothetical protein